ncbi:type I-B CRISPR-associated protein Cas7/Csh2 [Ancylomarina longa]|uniref:Type I-B CRISPR-associated protein Cas7/Csh2 n=1 Tax=Ancylomarina longa TaxID=2487017 RepID=A0A434ATM2_9BACT|nr:type I-B CRISPR-associated protein Cas7/Csh2 [Ancylomarina longa]RUT77771.1 type I-B CRISPR-associated protein Cas7/Csh2 [Ancylomarina longa]
MENTIEKSEILFLFESKYTIPNGDPFTGEQRYDEETKKVLVSDVRIKRYVRDYFELLGKRIFITENSPIGKTDVKKMVKHLAVEQKQVDIRKVMQSMIDVRLFGGISTIEKKESKVKIDSNDKQLINYHLNITGPTQFALLNPSLNKVDMRLHQNTSVMLSKADNEQGSIATTTVVPYAINQIQGWINPFSAEKSGLIKDDINDLFKAMWNSINNINTRSKSNQSSVLLLQIVYKEPTDKLYGTDRLVNIESEKEDEQIRSMEDYNFNFDKLKAITKSEKVKEIRFYTEIEEIKKQLIGDKFTEMTL